MSRKLKAALVGAVVLAVGGVASAAPFIGVNFVGGNNGGAPTALDPTDVAGVIAQANYNNVTGQSGTTGPLVNSIGVATAVTLTFSGAGTWGSGVGTGTPNQRLMNGYVDGQDVASGNSKNNYLFANVPSGVYNVIVYTLPDGLDGRDQSVTINGVSSSAVFVSSDAGANFNTNGFARATATSKDGAGATGNYVEFDGISPVAGFISLQGQSLDFRNFANGIQIVLVPEPGALGMAAVAGLGMLAGRRRRN
jgi:MYXO-CTERM domain-containing protein